MEAMAKSNVSKAPYPRVAEFYHGKSVLMTGAAGYLGVLMLETLLELCPGINKVYILLRERRGVQPEKRLDGILKKPVFDKVKQDMPEVLKKVHVVAGDISKPDFGMSTIDLQEIVENVTIIFHCAASINFVRPLKFILQHNVLSTQYAVDICRKLNKLDAFVYTSSSYGNSNRKSTIHEEIYRLPFHAQMFIDEIINGTDDSLDKLVAECFPPWPNFYTFSKTLAENLLQDNASDLPVIIVRPSIIGSVWKRPLPGYIEETSGITALSVGVGKGFLKILHGDPNGAFDFTTGDLSASVHIIAAWSVATNRCPPLHVINCTSCVSLTLQEYSEIMLKIMKKSPLPKSFRKSTGMRYIKNYFLYKILLFYEHYVPAYTFDALLKLSGSKMRLVPIYKMAEKANDATYYFMSNSWNFDTENYHNLVKQLQDEDRKLFELEELTSEGDVLANLLTKGAPFFQWSIDKKSPEDRMKSMNRRLWLTNIFKAVFLLGITAILYLIFSIVFAVFC